MPDFGLNRPDYNQVVRCFDFTNFEFCRHCWTTELQKANIKQSSHCDLEILDFLQENHKNVQSALGSAPGSAPGVQKEDTSDLNRLKNLKTV